MISLRHALRLLREAEVELWKPTLRASTKTKGTERNTEDQQFKMEFKSDLDRYKGRIDAYIDNKFKSYALLWERCAKAMQNRINARADFDKDVYNDPIELLRAIKEHSLNYQDTRYPMSIIADAYRQVFASRQHEGESLQDYTRRFKTSKEILISQVRCPLAMRKYMKDMTGYDRTLIHI